MEDVVRVPTIKILHPSNNVLTIIDHGKPFNKELKITPKMLTNRQHDS